LTYREEDEKQELIGFVIWMAEHDWIKEPHAKLMWWVDEFMKERKDAREWGK
jgi:hypothetical protein